MGNEILIWLSILFPVVAGCLLFVIARRGNRKLQTGYVAVVLVIEAGLAILVALLDKTVIEGFRLTPEISLLLCNDGLSGLFGVLVAFVWLVVGIYSYRYLKETRKPVMFYGFYLIALGVLQGLGLAGNLVSFYFFYEWMTLMTVPFVFYNRTKESIRASRKYLFIPFPERHFLWRVSFCLREIHRGWYFPEIPLWNLQIVQRC